MVKPSKWQKRWRTAKESCVFTRIDFARKVDALSVKFILNTESQKKEIKGIS